MKKTSSRLCLTRFEASRSCSPLESPPSSRRKRSSGELSRETEEEGSPWEDESGRGPLEDILGKGERLVTMAGETTRAHFVLTCHFDLATWIKSFESGPGQGHSDVAGSNPER